MQLCTYIMTYDYGFAPNPYGNYCTLAACTPNYRGIKVEVGDYMCGLYNDTNGYKIIYFMKITDKLGYHEYYMDKRFQYKKPKVMGTYQQKCGDNYYHKENGEWVRDKNYWHSDVSEYFEKETRYAIVFISNDFYYFGKDKIDLPKRYSALIPGRSPKRNHDQKLVEDFINWMESKTPKGKIDEPLHK